MTRDPGPIKHELKNDIGQLREFPEAALAPELADYVRLVKACAGAGRNAITAFPRSPTIVAAASDNHRSFETSSEGGMFDMPRQNLRNACLPAQ